MRLDILNNGYGIGPRMLFGIIRLFSGHPAPDAAKLTFYRPEFYGNAMKTFTQLAMRGPSAWSVADRELMAAYISKVNESPFCINTHTATAARAYHDRGKVDAALAGLDEAPLGEPLKQTLHLVGKLTREGAVDDADIRTVLSAGASPEQIEDALGVCFAFNTTARLANAFGFELLSPEGFDAGAKYLLKRGYG
jgi:AhpD family alkylhydroperoxidase